MVMAKQVEDDRNVSYIPDDIWMEIIARLPLRSICHVRRVSKTWYNLISELFSAKLFDVKSSPTNLIVLGKKSGPSRNLFMAEFNVTGDHPPTSLEVCDFDCEYGPAASCNGLVLLIGYYHVNPFTYCISNPIIGQYMKLPFPKDIEGRRAFCGFGFCSSSKLYKVIQFHYQEGKSTVVEIHTLGTYTWRETQIAPPEQVDKYVWTHGYIGVHSNGSLYWLGDRVFYRFDLENELFSSIDAPEFAVRRDLKLYGETRGTHYVSVHSDGALDVFFMKDLQWTRVFSISIPQMDGFPERDGTAVYAYSTDIVALGYYDFDSLEFYLMAWDLRADGENVVGVESISSEVHPIAYTPNFTSLSDVIAGETYQLKFRHVTKKYQPE